jgi:hypothetical protein
MNTSIYIDNIKNVKQRLLHVYFKLWLASAACAWQARSINNKGRPALNGKKFIANPVHQNRFIKNPVHQNRFIENSVHQNRFIENPVHQNRFIENPVHRNRFVKKSGSLKTCS